MIMNFKRISIRGRLAFALINFETFIKKNAPAFFYETGVKRIIDELWNVCVQDNIENVEELVNELAPYSILDNHPDNNFNDYKFLNYEEASKLKRDYLSLPEDIISVINLLTELAFGNMYGSTGEFSVATYEVLEEILEIYNEYNVDLICNKTIENSSFTENGGWGKIHPVEDWRAN